MYTYHASREARMAEAERLLIALGLATVPTPVEGEAETTEKVETKAAESSETVESPVTTETCEELIIRKTAKTTPLYNPETTVPDLKQAPASPSRRKKRRRPDPLKKWAESLSSEEVMEELRVLSQLEVKKKEQLERVARERETMTLLFTFLFEQLEREVQYDPSWKNEADYHDALVGINLHLGEGEMVKSRDPQGRRLVVIGTRYGNVCLFERKRRRGKEQLALAYNVPPEIKEMLRLEHAQLNYRQFTAIIGDSGFDNIGEQLRDRQGGGVSSANH